MSLSNKFISICLLTVVTTGCSRFSLLEENESVPKAQYDELLARYQDLEKKNKEEKALVAAETPADPNTVSESTKKLISDLAQNPESSEAKNTLLETVDVFDPKSSAGTASTPVAPNLSKAIDTIPLENSSGQSSNLEADISDLKKASALAGQGKFDDAIKSLQIISKKSSNRQIQVRSKFLTAEILNNQGEFDLALQVYEDIINNYAFSGLVIKSLQRAVGCCDKLKLSERKSRYESLLMDFFNS